MLEIVLTDKQLRLYDGLSRYSEVPFYYHKLDNKYTYGVASKLKKTKNFTTYTILQGDTLDKISLLFYKKPTYYWVLADFNNVIDPFAPLKVGATMRVPNISNIEFLG